MKRWYLLGLLGTACVFGLVESSSSLFADLDANEGYVSLSDSSLNLSRSNPWKVHQLQLELNQEWSVSKSFIRVHVGFQEGDQIDATSFRVATQQLYDTGWVDRLQWEVRKVGDQTLDVRLKLVIFPKIAEFRFIGNKEFGRKRLEFEMKSRINEACNPQRLQADAVRLKNFYTSKGLFRADVKVATRPLRDGYETVIIRIREDFDYKIMRVDFAGVKAFKPGQLRDLLETRKWWIFSFFLGTGILNEDRLRHDIDILRNHYLNAGYLDVEINRKDVVLQNKNSRLRVIFRIKEGIRYHVGLVSLTSDVPEDEPTLMAAIKLKKGDPVSVKAVEDTCEMIRDFYGREGYVDAQVDVKRTLVGEDEMDLAFSVVRGNQYRIHSIYLTGNIHSQSRLVLREMNLAPGDLLNRIRMKFAEFRLQNTGLFKSVTIASEDSSMPYEKDIKVGVEEEKTGNVSLTGAINSKEGPTVGLSVGQGNFDWKNSKDYLRGAGQKAQTGITVGKYSQNAGVNFEEPWLFDRELRWGFNVFGSRANLNHKKYKEQRVGTEVYIGKRLFEWVEGRLYYRIEHFKLLGADEDSVSKAVYEEQGKRIISKVGFELSRDTRDQFIHPTEGNFALWDNQVAGVGGQTRYVRTKAVFAQWFLVTPTYEQVFMIKCKGAAVRGWGGKKVPLFEREFLGGEDDLRGFDYQEAGPRSNDVFQDPLGGKCAFAGTSEYSIALHRRFRIIFYGDIGRVIKMNDKYMLPGSDTTYADIGIGTAIDIVSVPLKLFFSWPCKADKGSDKEFPHFSYSFGVTF